MNRRQAKVAERLCDMTNGTIGGPTYYPLENLLVEKVGSTTWYPVRAVLDSGKAWNYFLAADYGSFKGTFTLTGDWLPTEVKDYALLGEADEEREEPCSLCGAPSGYACTGGCPETY